MTLQRSSCQPQFRRSLFLLHNQVQNVTLGLMQSQLSGPNKFRAQNSSLRHDSMRQPMMSIITELWTGVHGRANPTHRPQWNDP